MNWITPHPDRGEAFAIAGGQPIFAVRFDFDSGPIWAGKATVTLPRRRAGGSKRYSGSVFAGDRVDPCPGDRFCESGADLTPSFLPLLPTILRG